jgi:hypothetical protein
VVRRLIRGGWARRDASGWDATSHQGGLSTRERLLSLCWWAALLGVGQRYRGSATVTATTTTTITTTIILIIIIIILLLIIIIILLPLPPRLAPGASDASTTEMEFVKVHYVANCMTWLKDKRSEPRRNAALVSRTKPDRDLEAGQTGERA